MRNISFEDAVRVSGGNASNQGQIGAAGALGLGALSGAAAGASIGLRVGGVIGAIGGPAGTVIGMAGGAGVGALFGFLSYQLL